MASEVMQKIIESIVLEPSSIDPTLAVSIQGTSLLGLAFFPFVGFVFGAVKAVALGEGTRADEGAALVALGAAAAMTGLFKWLAKRRKERRKGNMSPAVFVSPGKIKTSSAGSAAA